MRTSKPSPRRAGKAAAVIAALVAAIIAIIFVGRNVWHYKAASDARPAKTDQQDRPHSPHDLTVDPPTVHTP